MRVHTMYPALLRAYFACRSAGADRATELALRRRRDALLEDARVRREENAQNASGFFDAHTHGQGGEEMDDFIARCTAELRAYSVELNAIARESEDACAEFERRVATITASAAKIKIDDERARERGGGGGTPADAARGVDDDTVYDDEDEFGDDDDDDDDDESTDASAWVRKQRKRAAANAAAAAAAAAGGGSKKPPAAPAAAAAAGPSLTAKHVDTREDDLRKSLKRKYATSISSLRDEFLRKRKKGKLPTDATEALKKWWSDNVVWPYPSEDDKRALSKSTNLSATQINNWFINQRKRHWHKLFKGVTQPASEEEAAVALRRAFGTLEKALEVARAS